MKHHLMLTYKLHHGYVMVIPSTEYWKNHTPRKWIAYHSFLSPLFWEPPSSLSSFVVSVQRFKWSDHSFRHKPCKQYFTAEVLQSSMWSEAKIIYESQVTNICIWDFNRCMWLKATLFSESYFPPHGGKIVTLPKNFILHHVIETLFYMRKMISMNITHFTPHALLRAWSFF